MEPNETSKSKTTSKPRRGPSEMQRLRIAAGYATQADVIKRLKKLGLDRSVGWYSRIEADGLSGNDRIDAALARMFNCTMNHFRPNARGPFKKQRPQLRSLKSTAPKV